MSEFTPGNTWANHYTHQSTAEIHHSSGAVIRVTADSQAAAEQLQERILAALETDITPEDIKLLEDLVSLGGTYAEDAVVQGLRSWHPFTTDKMRDLASGGYGRAFEILKQLKIMQGERDGS